MWECSEFQKQFLSGTCSPELTTHICTYNTLICALARRIYCNMHNTFIAPLMPASSNGGILDLEFLYKLPGLIERTLRAVRGTKPFTHSIFALYSYFLFVTRAESRLWKQSQIFSVVAASRVKGRTCLELYCLFIRAAQKFPGIHALKIFATYVSFNSVNA